MNKPLDLSEISGALSAVGLGVAFLALDTVCPADDGVFSVAVYRTRYEGEGEAKICRGALLELEEAKTILPHGLGLPAYFVSNREAATRMSSVQTLLNWLPPARDGARYSARMRIGHPLTAF